MGMMDDMLEKAGVDEQSEELAELSQVGRQRNICSHAAFTWKNGPNLGKYQPAAANLHIYNPDVCSALNLSVSSC